jgi:hypothetical protein
MIDIDKYEGHTEGPWEWDDLHSTGEEKLFVHKKGDDNNLIAEVSGKINGKSECANAQLMADAPLLLAEVKQLRKIIEDVHLALTVDDWYCDRPVDARITNALGILSEVIE